MSKHVCGKLILQITLWVKVACLRCQGHKGPCSPKWEDAGR